MRTIPLLTSLKNNVSVLNQHQVVSIKGEIKV